MAFKASSSRFAFLVDDAPDPFVTTKKNKPKSAEGGSNNNASHKKDQAGKNKKKAGGGTVNGNKSSSTSATKGTDRKEVIFSVQFQQVIFFDLHFVGTTPQ